MGIKAARDRWRGEWCNINLGRREQYKNREAHMKAFHQLDETQIFYQEEGMKAFVKLEQRLLRRARYAPYRNAGQNAFDQLASAYMDGQLTSATDVVFVSLDFEGKLFYNKPWYGLRGFGTAELDTRRLIDKSRILTPNDIQCENYELTAKTRGGFLFGKTTKIDKDQLRFAILSEFQVLGDDAMLRKVVLVSHGTGNELHTLETLDITLERDLPQVIGMLCTDRLALEMHKRGASLGQLLTRLEISSPQRSLHCAGNDACFALKAMVGLLQQRHSGVLDDLNELKRLPSRIVDLEWRNKRDDSVDWFSVLDGDPFLELS